MVQKDWLCCEHRLRLQLSIAQTLSAGYASDEIWKTRGMPKSMRAFTCLKILSQSENTTRHNNDIQYQ